MSWNDENTLFQVVINHEQQYSIWPKEQTIPPGWQSVGKTGKKDQCLAYINEVWTDMRPLSLRQHLAKNNPSPQ